MEILGVEYTADYDRNAGGGSVNAGNEACAGGLQACSACAGDYEDPEGTAWDDDEDAEGSQGHQGDDAGPDARREFPVERE